MTSARRIAIPLGLALVVAGLVATLLWPDSGSAPESGPPAGGATSAPGARPETFVGLTQAGDVVVADVATGKVLRTLVSRDVARGETARLRTLRLSPDRKTLYFVIHRSDDCSEVASVPMAGGPFRVVARGDSPTLNPAGTRLAYVQLLNCGEMRSRVVVRDLASGREDVWHAEAPGSEGVPSLAADITWTGRDDSIVVWACGVDACAPGLLNLTKPGSTIRHAAKPLPGPKESDAFWGCIGLRGRHGTLVARHEYSSSTGTEAYPIDEIDPATMRVQRLVGNGRDLGCPAFDAAGDNALSVREGRVVGWNVRGAFPVARGYLEAVW